MASEKKLGGRSMASEKHSEQKDLKTLLFGDTSSGASRDPLARFVGDLVGSFKKKEPEPEPDPTPDPSPVIINPNAGGTQDMGGDTDVMEQETNARTSGQIRNSTSSGRDSKVSNVTTTNTSTMENESHAHAESQSQSNATVSPILTHTSRQDTAVAQQGPTVNVNPSLVVSGDSSYSYGVSEYNSDEGTGIDTGMMAVLAVAAAAIVVVPKIFGGGKRGSKTKL